MAKKVKKETESNKEIQLSLPIAKKILSVIDLHDLKLKSQEIRFVAAFCSTWDKEKAYKQAGYQGKKPNIVSASISRLLNKVNINTAIQRYAIKMIEPYKDRLNIMLLEIWYKRAFYKITTFYHEDGKRKKLEEIPDEWLVCIDGMKNKRYGPYNEKLDIEWEIGSRADALKEIRVILEMVTTETGGNVMAEIMQRLELVRKRNYKELGFEGIIPFKKVSNE